MRSAGSRTSVHFNNFQKLTNMELAKKIVEVIIAILSAVLPFLKFGPGNEVARLD